MEEQSNHFKRTRSQRSSSSSNETSSPTEKRSKSDKVDLDRCEVLSKVDFVMTNTSDNPDKLDLILKKLEKLDAIELTLRDMASRISKNESAVETLQSDTRAVLYEFLKTTLGFEDPRRIEIQRVHRIGKSITGKPTPILARFLRFPDREMILRQGFRLKDTEFMILQDFPQEIIEKRRKMMPKLKQAKDKGLRVSFSKSEPDKLIINGKVVS